MVDYMGFVTDSLYIVCTGSISRNKHPFFAAGYVDKYQLPEGSNVSISVYDLTANEALYDYQVDKLSRPASTMKLLTTITALARPETDELSVRRSGIRE